ncbi:phage integrase N-terminal domain-containing protein [Legionella israelensis]|uniref:Putative integrase N-terminal domain-containing protein n=1 Tax=Legionella israelensis TaxID=454 RepID=A0A0W0W0K0_9GAMM|nr:phage integrase N-terminal domain-containing protein [Legionella israelensis]KTD26052.1 hypothetical protein Lisr_1193 [Legionella israelensis]QBS10157.1 hypothetical protein E4T55_10000 [Legionella israelensis]SCY26413.1 Phage integrase, N-terminal [Legionella israelensis DSM 19235]STX59748.1 putative integrase [Legionella israelensis]
MRRYSLRQTINNYLKSNRCGSHRDKQYRQFVIYKMLDDLFVLGETPSHWQALTANQLEKLIQHWKKQRITVSTMMNYMTIIRKFLHCIGHDLAGIDNQNLRLKRKTTSHKIIRLKYDGWQKLHDPIAQVLMGFQMHFGLTLSETMRLLPDVHVQNNHLLLTREITFNHLDRKVPIRTPTQMAILRIFHHLTQKQHCLINSFGYRVVCFRWQKAMKALRWPAKKSYRYMYAQLTQASLSSQLDHYRLSILIMDEMGLKSRTTLWSYLNEQQAA